MDLNNVLNKTLIAKEDMTVTINSHIHNPVGQSKLIRKGTECTFDRTNWWDNCFFEVKNTGEEFKIQFHPSYIEKYFTIL